MLQTLKEIGSQLLEGKGVWAKLTTEPDLSKLKGDKKYWVCPILFDCQKSDIRILEDEMELFIPNDSSIRFKYVKATRKGPSQSKFDLTVEASDVANLQESLFGNKKKESGCFITLKKEFVEAEKTGLGKALNNIQNQLGHIKYKVEKEHLKEVLGDKFKDVILFTAFYKADVENDVIPLFEYPEFHTLVQKVFTRNNPKSGISFVTGNEIPDAVQAQFWSRYNIHKVFQTSSYNYAAGFDTKSFYKNYQGNDDDFDSLDRASKYVLDNLRTYIAGIPHIIIPNYRKRDLENFDIEEVKLFLDKSSDLLFRYQSLESDIERKLPETDLFWINYIAFESDGNSFKVMNHIKDVNSKYLTKLTDTFNSVGIDFKDYIGGKYLFNLQTIFNIIPVRDGNKSKINPALNLFKEILEQNDVNQENLYSHFIDLALCHRYKRYSAFKNIRENESFDFAIKDAIYKYSALIYALKQLNLINMDNESHSSNEENEKKGSDYQKRIEQFFSKMSYSEHEKAIFYLGRILSTVAYAQYDKGHESKPVLNKINFNGMDADAIVRLSLDLREKTRQYNIHNKTDWDFGRFTDRFNEKNWPLSKEQNVFYLMAGYSFGLTKSSNNS